MARVRISGPARADVLDIWLFIAQDSPQNAERFTSVLYDKFITLSRYPAIGRRRDDLKPGMRSLPASNYMIYYRKIAGGVSILRVVHAGRDVGQILDRKSVV